MDQYKTSSIAKDDAYKAQVPLNGLPVPEVLATFGDEPSEFDAQNGCVGPVPTWGGVKGHWTYTDTAAGRALLTGNHRQRLTAMLCFEDATKQSILVVPRVQL